MIFLVALIPATGLTVAGYLVLYLAGRSEGSLRTFGRYLGFWAFTLAGLVVLGAMFAAGHMHREHEGLWGMHEEMHRRWLEDRRDVERSDRDGGTPTAPGAPPAGASPTPAAPASPSH